MDPSGAVAVALERVRRELTTAPRRLDPDRYLQTQASYEGHSDQRIRIAAWLGTTLHGFADRPTLRVLSIGCGDGSLDVAVATTLADGDRSIDYVGVDPNTAALDRFRLRLNSVPGVRATSLASRIEDIAVPGRFDLILAIHSLYYVDDVGRRIEDLIDLLVAAGLMIIVQAPLAGINTLVEAFAVDGSGPRLWYSEEVAARLRSMSAPASQARIDAMLDIEPCWNPASTTGREILEFLAHINLDGTAPSLREAMLSYLALIAFDDRGIAVPHPVDLFVVRH